MNFNYNECIKEKSNVGEKIYYNICTNEKYSVKWGSDTWIGVIVVFITTIIIIILLILLIKDCFETQKYFK